MGTKESNNTKPIALAGKVPVKVTLEGGLIKPGDYLTSSSTLGYAMKATKAGPTVAKALEAFDGSNVTTGKILAMVSLDYYIPENETATAEYLAALKSEIELLKSELEKLKAEMAARE